MMDFRDRVRIYQPGLLNRRREARFEGKRNSTKAKAFLMLVYSKTADEQEGWLTARQLAWLTGVSYGSLLVLLPRWVSWRYLKRMKLPLVNSAREVFCYQITDKGQRYLRRHQTRMPLDRYESEMDGDRRARGYIE